MPRVNRGADGTCYDCPNQATPPYRRCVACRQRNAKINGRRRTQRRANHQCTSCGAGTDGSPRCISCTPKRAASTRRLRQSKRELIRKAKDKPCADCGRHWPYTFMEFDHCRGTKLFTISADGKGHSIDIILTEIAKCVVRCVVCHRARTGGVLPPLGWIK